MLISIRFTAIAWKLQRVRNSATTSKGSTRRSSWCVNARPTSMLRVRIGRYDGRRAGDHLSKSVGCRKYAAAPGQLQAQVSGHVVS
jgi:hypothetical protein